MNFIALKILTGDRAKYLGLIFAIAFCTFLLENQTSIFAGILNRTGSQILDVTDADLRRPDRPGSRDRHSRTNYRCSASGSNRSGSSASIVQKRPVETLRYLARLKQRPRSGSYCSPAYSVVLVLVPVECVRTPKASFLGQFPAAASQVGASTTVQSFV
jgi:hypothetical protein